MALSHFPNGITSFGVPITGAGEGNAFGQPYYVNPDNSTYPDKDRTVSTIQAAINIASAYDTIYIRGAGNSAGQTNDYSETVTIPYDKPGLSLIAQGNSPSESVLWTPAAQNDTMISVLARDVTVQGFRFRPNGTTGWVVKLYKAVAADTSDASGFTMRDCIVRSTTQTSNGIAAGNTAGSNNQGANDVTIQNVTFTSCVAPMLCDTPATVPNRLTVRDVRICGDCTYGIRWAGKKGLFERLHVSDLGAMMLDTDPNNGGTYTQDNMVTKCTFGDEESDIAEVHCGTTDCWAGSIFGDFNDSATYIDTTTGGFIVRPDNA